MFLQLRWVGTRKQTLDLAGLQQKAQPELINARVVAHGGEVGHLVGAARHDRRNQVFRDAAQAEAAHDHRRARGDVGDCLFGASYDLVAAARCSGGQEPRGGAAGGGRHAAERPGQHHQRLRRLVPCASAFAELTDETLPFRAAHMLQTPTFCAHVLFSESFSWRGLGRFSAHKPSRFSAGYAKFALNRAQTAR
jgi:hypothetical protein